MSSQDEIRLPRLRFRDVVARGALYGLAAIPLLGLVSLTVADHHDRETFLAVAAGFALVSGGAGLIGAIFWALCGGDIRRCRDWRTVRGQTEGVTIAAPVLVRLGVLALVLFPGALGLYHLVDNAGYDSWIYGD